jgi:ABC-type multidrug transport system fused ATPase/permease subunit
VALLVAAITTLVVPVAVRRMIDFGFDAGHIGLINQYFGVMIAVVAVLAVASASRYYLVTTLGERVVADLRSAVFGHLISLSAPFFDTARTGELTSRLTADTTQIKSAVGSSVSVALRNVVLFLGSATMMVITSPKLSGFRARRHSADRAAARWLRPLGAAPLADGPGHACRRFGLRGRTDRRGADLAGLHQRAAGSGAVFPKRSSAPIRPRSNRHRRARSSPRSSYSSPRRASWSSSGSARRT